MDQAAQDNYVLARSRLWTPDLDKLLRKWKKQVGRKERGHRDLARKYTRRHYMFGLPAVILSTLITAGAFATFQECGTCDDQQSKQCKAEVWIRLAVGVLGIISIGLTSSVTFLNYQQIAENHKSAADMFGERFREIDSMLQIPGPLRGDPISTLQSIRSQYDNDVRNAPVLPKKYELELTYDVMAPIPPSPGQVKILLTNGGHEQRKTDTATLKKLLSDEERGKEEDSDESVTITMDEALKARNEHDTDDEKDVCIAFDLDCVPNYSQATTALAVAALAAKKREEEQLSLQRAFAFEMQRMEISTQKLHCEKRSPGKKVKRGKKELPNNRNLKPEDEHSKENVQGGDSSSSEKETS